MDTAIIAALIGGACTLVASILTLLIKEIIDQRKLYKPAYDRREALLGKWQGQFIQRDQEKNNTFSYPTSFSFIPHRKVIKGEASYTRAHTTIDNANRLLI